MCHAAAGRLPCGQSLPSWWFHHVPHSPQGQLAVPHGLVVDDCDSALYIADRETSAVHRFRFSDERPPPPPATADDSHRHRRTLRQHSRRLHQASAAGAAIAAARSAGGAGAGPGPLRQRPRRRPLQGGVTEAADMGPADGEADAGTADAGPAGQSTMSVDGEVDADMPQEAGPEDSAGNGSGNGFQMPTEDWQPYAGDENGGPDFTLDLQVRSTSFVHTAPCCCDNLRGSELPDCSACVMKGGGSMVRMRFAWKAPNVSGQGG